MKRSELKQIIREVIEESINTKTKELINSFNETLTPFDLKRGNCGLTAANLVVYLQKRGIDSRRQEGSFKVDTPSYIKNDFAYEELMDAKKKGYNMNEREDRIKYAKDVDLIDELKLIPHYWVEIDDEIVDPTGYAQFVKTKLSKDLDKLRYIKV